MDIVRAPKKKTGRNIAIVAGVLVLGTATVLLAKLDPAAPTVERSTLLVDSVGRGDIVRDVRAPGTLVPEQIRYVTAQASARVERLDSESGQNVKMGDLLLSLSNPDLQIQRSRQTSRCCRRRSTCSTCARISARNSAAGGRGGQHQHAARERGAGAARTDSLAKMKLVSPFEQKIKAIHTR